MKTLRLIPAGTRSIIILLIAPLFYGVAFGAILWKFNASGSQPAVEAPGADFASTRVKNQSVSSDLLTFAVSTFLVTSTLTTGLTATILVRSEQEAGGLAAESTEYSVRVQKFSSEIAAMAQMTSSSIDEIARSSQVAVNALTQALNHAEQSSDIVKSLGSQSDAVTELVGAITSISEQTNLLALNATIESARAGEAGKGFSVVANEVKQLANDTRLTSQRVIDRVRGIQKASNETISTTFNVLSLMKQCAQSQAAIATAVEEQRTIASTLARHAVELASQAGGAPESFRPITEDCPPQTNSREFSNAFTETKKTDRRPRLKSITHSITT